MKKYSADIFGLFIVVLALFISSYTGIELGTIGIILLAPGVVYVSYLFYRINNPKDKVSNNEDLKEALDKHKKLLKKAGFTDELVEHEKMAENLLSAKQATSNKKNL